jgi:hypothetical protein
MNILERWIDEHRTASIVLLIAAAAVCSAVIVSVVCDGLAPVSLSAVEFEQTEPVDGLYSLYRGIDNDTLLATMDLGNFTEELKTDVYQRGYDGKWFRVDNLYLIDWGTAAPTSGKWGVGCIVFDSTPTAGQPVGWVCVTAGTPGTWKAFGTIAN